ncbi:MAG: hypothetical protein AAGJ51_01355 [Pseudomonadota bacterium]
MRCSICLAELKETPEGLKCEACDTLLEPMVDEDADLLESNVSRFDRRTWSGIAAGAAVAVALFFWGIVYFAPGQQAGEGAPDQTGLVAKLGGDRGFIKADESGIVLEALRVNDLAGAVTLIVEKGCQRLSSDAVEAVQWVDITGNPVQLVRPDLPGNWSLDFACATQDRGAMIGTLLQDGVAISRVDTSGNLIWTQLKTSSGVNSETVAVALLDQTLYVLSQETASGQVKIASIDQSGDENWALPIAASARVARPKITRNSFGEILFAWNEGANAVRLMTLSASGIIVQDTLLPDRILPLKAISDDDIARTLILQGEDETFAELVSASGAAEWQWQDDAAGTPLGVLRDEQAFLVFAASGTRLLAWKLDARGNVSNRLEVALADEIASGDIMRLNAVEAVAAIDFVDGAPVDLVLDLRRLSNGLTIETPDLPAITLAAADVAIEEGEQGASTPIAVPVAEAETFERDVIETSGESRASEPAALEIDPIAPAPVPTTEPTDALPNEDASTGSETTGPIPVLEPQSDPSVARCTFTCVALDAAAAEYTLMQSVEINEGETLTDVSLRLNDTHETLCSVSGGEPAPDYARQCGR